MPYLWIWLIIAPPLLALVDFMTSSASTSFGRRDSFGRDDRMNRAAPIA